MVDNLPLGNIKPGEGRLFNVNDVAGTCVYEIAIRWLDGQWASMPEDLCKLSRAADGLVVYNNR